MAGGRDWVWGQGSALVVGLGAAFFLPFPSPHWKEVVQEPGVQGLLLWLSPQHVGRAACSVASTSPTQTCPTWPTRPT